MNDSRRPSALLSPDVLRQLRAAVEKQSSSEQSDWSWRLAEIDRALGDLATAASGYAACANDSAARFLFELMRGEAANPEPPPEGPRPVPFVLLQAFLPAAELAAVREAVDRLQQHLIKARVGRGADRRIDLEARVGHAVTGGPELRGLLLPRVKRAIAVHGMLGRLGIAAIATQTSEVAVASYITGGKYGPHRDEYGQSTRRLTSVFYIHDEPKTFVGGDLLLHDDPGSGKGARPWFTRIIPVRNAIIFFPADRVHEVTPVQCTSTDAMAGRLAVSIWFHDAMAQPFAQPS
jgi:hypothetical protein